ncbi:hypothetical protein PENTCL1PPCAC_29660, partial [Pristionchus entomophagus]
MVRDLREEDADVKVIQVEPFRIYNCLPVSREKKDRKEEKKEQEDDSRKSSETCDDREQLYRFLKTVMHERGRNTHNVVVMTEHKLTLKVLDEDYAFGDVLWLILRARFHGNTDGSDDGAMQENDVVTMLRNAKIGILDRVRSLKFDAPPAMDAWNPSTEYMDYLRRSKAEIDNVLSLFPHSKGLLAACQTAKDPFVSLHIIPRIELLTAVSNTITDLNEKLETLGVLIGLEKESCPTLSNPSVQFEDLKKAISVFVRNSLTLKGMSKILSRVSTVCDTSMTKAIDLLKLPPKSYAHAVMNQIRTDGAPSSIYSSIGQQMNIPNPLPLAVLIERIRLALLEEW